jgi:hypothetical protein
LEGFGNDLMSHGIGKEKASAISSDGWMGQLDEMADGVDDGCPETVVCKPGY